MVSTMEIEATPLLKQSDTKARLRSIRIAQISGMIMFTGMSIMISGTYPYLEELCPLMPEDVLLTSNGWISSMYPLGQIIASPIFGYIYQRNGSPQNIILPSSLTFLLGNVLYAILSVFEEKHRYHLMLLSRFVIGASSGNMAILRAYIAGATYVTERTTELSLLLMCMSIGFTAGPGIQAILAPLGAPNYVPNEKIVFDMYSMIGWIGAILGVLNMILFSPFVFQDFNVSSCENTSDASKELPKIDILPLLTCGFNSIVALTFFAVVESLGAPMAMDYFGWVQDETLIKFGIIMTFVGILTILLFAFVGPLTKIVDERKLLIGLGFPGIMLCSIAWMPLPGQPFPQNCSLEWCQTTPALTLWQFVCGIIFTAISYPFLLSISESLFTKIIGPRSQGNWIAMLYTTGTMARFVGSNIGNNIYAFHGPYWFAMFFLGMTTFALLLTLIMYKRLVPLCSAQ